MCTGVFICIDSLKKPLETPDEGLYPFLECINNKIYKKKVKENPQAVIVDNQNQHS